MIQPENLREKYLYKADSYSVLCLKEKKILLTLSISRLVVFVIGVGAAIFCFSLSVSAGVVSLLLFISLFLFLLNRFVFHSEKKEFYANLETINRNELNALSGDLTPFDNGSRWIDINHDFSHDIDLFGNDSLFHFLNRTISGYGREKLAGWLSSPYELSAVLKNRQKVISELAAKIDWRQKFTASGIGKSIEKEDIEGILEWLNKKHEYSFSFLMKIIIWVLPVSAIIALVLLITGFLPYGIFIMLFIVNLIIVLLRFRETQKIHLLVSKKHEFLSSLERLLSAFETELFESDILIELRKRICESELSAVRSLGRLSRIIQSFDSRLNFIVGFSLNGLLLWDLHCIRWLENWKEESKDQFPDWLEKVGELDAYISLSNFAFNNPSYSFPEVSGPGEIFIASGIGHPLIPDSKRICNDFSISGTGRVFVITGANMSGKSTFLRTIAINYILAMTGAPVCADSMKFTPLKLFTSMRTTDSLSNNESYFYAELRRLNILKSKIENRMPVLFILDEILKGTNSEDKSTGSKLFLQRIVENGGTGLIATHDTSLAKLETAFPGVIINKCFEIEIDGKNIRFDYKLQNGITQKMNAVFLMKQMGILD